MLPKRIHIMTLESKRQAISLFKEVADKIDTSNAQFSQ